MLLCRREIRYEIILIDDGSTDGSGVICDQYAGRFDFIQVFHQRNQGLSVARNRGIELSVGKYLLFVDSDDCLVEKGLDNVADDLKCASADIIFFRSYKWYSDHSMQLVDDDTCIGEKQIGNRKELLSALCSRNRYPAAAWGKAFRRDLIVIGYTSDTKFFPELLEYLQESDIIIFNISDIYEKDIRGYKSKSNHLGYNGSIRILKSDELPYQLAIASEFCCTNGDYRMKLVKKLREQADLEEKRYVIVGEVGLQVSLDNLKVVCSRCKCAESLDKVVVVAPKLEFGKIEYICNQCRETLAGIPTT